MFDSLIIFLALTASCTVTGVLRAYALKRKLLDVPNDRSSHTAPIPRGGGLAIVLTFLGAIIWFYLTNKISFAVLMVFFVGGALVAGIGLLDDYKHVSARWRLLVHFVAAGFALYWLGSGIQPIPFGSILWQPGWFGYLVGTLLLVWTLNLFNFMDGIDGLAGFEAISVAGGAAAIIFLQQETTTEFILLLFLVAGCTGFLVWNWPPAKIFMGDVGSGFLGYTIGVFALLTSNSGILSLWVWMILGGVFLVDATVTLTRRLFQGEKVYQAHCSHAYQNAARIYKSHKKVTMGVLFINLVWLFPLAFSASLWPDLGWLFSIVALTPLVVLAIKLGAGLRDFRI